MDEWTKIRFAIGEGEKPIWQSKTNPAAFSTDGGETYFLITDDYDKDGRRPVYKSEKT